MDPPRWLTLNAVLYLSLGFRQHYTMQVLTARRAGEGELQLVLYDGLAYIGALLPPRPPHPRPHPSRAPQHHPHPLPDPQLPALPPNCPQEFDVVRICPLSFAQNEPITIDSIEVLQTGLSSLLGKEVITLEEFMRRRGFARRAQEQEERAEGRARKQLKGDDDNTASTPPQTLLELDRPNSYVIEEDEPQQQQQQQESREDVPAQKAGSVPQESMVIEDEASQGNKQPAGSSSQEKAKDEVDTQRLLSLLSSKSVSREQTLSFSKKPIEIDLQQLPPCLPPPALKEKQVKASMFIRDLYERMHRFRLICRVNHLTHFTSQRGVACIKLILIDEQGDEIVCMLFDRPQDRPELKMAKGRSYVFENGEVRKEEAGLSLAVQWSGVTELQRFMPSFVPARMLRLGQLAKESSFFVDKTASLSTEVVPEKKPKVVNICGIFRGFKEQPKLLKTQFRVSGILCDPDHELSIQFTLIVDELSSFPEQGAAISLHSVQPVQDERTLRLECSKRSYILDERGNAHEYFADLVKSSSSGEWKLVEYRNLSEVSYVTRTIGELKALLSRMLEQDTAYSEIDCSIVSIAEKRLYNSCGVCRRETRENTGIYVYCLNCKKNVRFQRRAHFDLEVSDSSGSLTATLFSDDMQGFLNIAPEHYTGQGREQRGCFLQLCAYSSVVMRVRSRREVGGASHTAVWGSRFNQRRGVARIKALSIEEKTKYTAW